MLHINAFVHIQADTYLCVFIDSCLCVWIQYMYMYMYTQTVNNSKQKKKKEALLVVNLSCF